MPVRPARRRPTRGGAASTFDALGGGSSTIDVYPGVQAAQPDKLANGTFSDGQTTTALCKTTGRTVHSDPSVGEQAKESDQWVRVLAQPGKTSYATLAYGRIDDAALALHCQPASTWADKLVGSVASAWVARSVVAEDYAPVGLLEFYNGE